MAEIRIESSGGSSTEVAELYGWLCEDPKTSALGITHDGTDDGSLALIDTILASIQTIAALVGLCYAIAAFQNNKKMSGQDVRKAQFQIIGRNGKRLEIETELDSEKLEQITEFYRDIQPDKPQSTSKSPSDPQDEMEP